MKVMITGATGQLGQQLVRDFSDTYEVIGLSRTQLDVTNRNHVSEIFKSIRPDVVIHAAAYTAVDAAETDQDRAYSINAYGTRNIAVASEYMGAKVCFISTDYVFDGDGSVPYREFDITNPQSVYGKSKRAGEQLVQSLSSKYFIVRTSWVYGLEGKNFVKTMLELAQQRNRLTVVHDQVGCPTYTRSLTRFLMDLVSTDSYGVYHATNSGTCSWFEFAKAIFEEARVDIEVEPCSTQDFPRPAPRPKYSVLDNLSIRVEGFCTLPHWREDLRQFITEYFEQKHSLANNNSNTQGSPL